VRLTASIGRRFGVDSKPCAASSTTVADEMPSGEIGDGSEFNPRQKFEERGVARAVEPGFGGKRSQDGEAQPPCSKRRAGGP
jgi:hypothetical protein